MKKSRMKSIQFEPTSSIFSEREGPVTLEIGMEREHKFSEENQEEG